MFLTNNQNNTMRDVYGELSHGKCFSSKPQKMFYALLKYRIFRVNHP